MQYISHNGQILAAESAVSLSGNRALHSGMGLLETMLFDGGIKLWRLHYDRLLRSARILKFPLRQLDQESILSEIYQLIKANRREQQATVVRLQVNAHAEKQLQFTIKCREVPDANQPVILGIVPGIVKQASPLSHLKTTSRDQYDLAAEAAYAKGWGDALLLNQYGRVAESTIANIFWKEKEQMFTPSLTEGCVAGVFREHLLSEGNFSVIEKALEPEQLAQADALYLCNAVRGLYPIMFDRG